MYMIVKHFVVFVLAHTAARYGYLGLRWVGTQNSSATMDVVTLNALDDNYMYLVKYFSYFLYFAWFILFLHSNFSRLYKTKKIV